MKQFVRGLFVAVLLASAGGCFWPAPGAGPSRQAFNPFETAITPDTVGSLERAWVANTDDGSANAPVVSRAGVHTTSGLSVYGFNTSTGARMWKVDLSSLPAALPVVGHSIADGDQLITSNGTVNFGGSYTTTLRNPATGAGTGSPGPSGLLDSVRGSTLVVEQLGFRSPGAFFFSISVFDRADSTRRWSGLIDAWATGSSAGGGDLSLGTNAVYQAGFGTNVGPPAARGNGLRAYPLTPPTACPPPLDLALCPTWSTLLDGTTSTAPVLGDSEQSIFTGTDAGTVYAVNGSTGAIQWSVPVGAAVTDSPALANGSLYVPTADGDLVVLDAATGATQWTALTGSRIGVQPAVAGGVVFTGSDNGSVQAFNAAGCGSAVCGSLWSDSTGTAAITGDPAVNQGQLYVGTSDSRLIAYRLPAD
jgi:outer membrane protein assembly factor BamB